MNKRHIYLVEDDPDDYFLFSTTFREVNNSVQITWFKTGQELFDALNDSNNVFPDLILLDMNMPGNDGLECLQIIKKDSRLNRIPIIILSTAKTAAIEKNAFEYGASKYLIKPFSLEELKNTINEILSVLKAN